MKVIGLTGSIGMGKSTVAEMLRQDGILVHESDHEVHDLLGPNGKAVQEVRNAFSGEDIYLKDKNAIDRGALGALVFFNESAMEILEDILHPLVREAQQSFILAARHEGHEMVVLDIPLLFETRSDEGAHDNLDAVMVVSAPYSVQEKRVLARPGMTEEKFHAILETQMPDEMKCAMADYVIPTGISKAHTQKELRKIIEEIRRK